ncbi:glycosyl hydrolase family 65 protein [Fusibacter bizertensis]
MDWKISSTHYDSEATADNGNRFLIGNGYMGIRGTLDECTKEQLVAINLAGIYDQVGTGWREPLNAPNPLWTQLVVNGKNLDITDENVVSHEMDLDFRNGVFHRKTTWKLSEGQVTLESKRFASIVDAHLIGLRYSVTSTFDADVSILAGIDGDVWDINGPHYEKVTFDHSGHLLISEAFVQNKSDQVAVLRLNHIDHNELFDLEAIYPSALQGILKYSVKLPMEQTLDLSSTCLVYTTKDGQNPLKIAKAHMKNANYEEALKVHLKGWEDIWSISEVEIVGDEEAEVAMNYSLYHLNIAAPRHCKNLSIPARALSGQTYKGAVFWDTEMFMLDYFLYTQPEVAKTLIEYRIDTLGGAREKAKSYGFEGAFYAWESQEGGFDACSDYNVTDVFTQRPIRTYFKDKQLHISSAVVKAIMQYFKYTSDNELLTEGGLETVIECALFYRSALIKPILKEKYEIHDVIGPDEYHERVNNNAYTNYMAWYCIHSALELVSALKEYDRDKFLELDQQLAITQKCELLNEVINEIHLPKPNEEKIIEQFDGYFKLEDTTPAIVKSRLKHPKEYWGGGNGVASDTQVIKQADVVTMLECFHEDFSKSTLKANWMYYEPRTEHGSSLSACMYAMLACRFDEPDKAYPFFMKSATTEMRGGGKQWAGLVYIGGTHPAASGGAWKNLIQGFAGLKFVNDEPVLTPNLPTNWKTLRFQIKHKSNIYAFKIEGKKATYTIINS